MDDQIEVLADAAKSRAAEIVALVEHVMAGADESMRTAAIEEAQDVILSLVAAVIAADGATTHQEFIYAALVTKDSRDPLRCRVYLDDYAARWKEIAEQPPSFLLAAIDYDVRNATKICPMILEKLRIVVQHTAAVDGELTDSETSVGDDLLRRVDALFRQARWSVKWDENSLPFIHISRTIARDDFHNREIV